MPEIHNQRTSLDREIKPVAIIHGGMYVFANRAFLKLFGYNSFDELEGIPALDMVDDRHEDRLRNQLVKASRRMPGKKSPTEKLTFITIDGDQMGCFATCSPSVFEGEKSITLSLVTEKQNSIGWVFLNLPWKAYFSSVFLLLFIMLPVLLLLNLNINNAPKVFLPKDAPSVLLNDRLREFFPSDQVMVLLFEGVALYSDGFLSAFNELAERLDGHPLIEQVVNVTNQDHIGGTEEGFFIEPLIDVDTLEDTRPKQRRQEALSDRFAVNGLIAGDGEALSMIVTPVTQNDSFQRLELEEVVFEELKELRLGGYLSAVAGLVTVDIAELKSMLRDNMIFIPVTVMIGLLMIWWLFQRWLVVIVSGLAVGVVISSTVAFYVIFEQPFNLISSIIPPLLSALTFAALVHLFNALHLASMRGLTGPDRVNWALREIRQPARYTAFTTIAGLSSLGLSPIPPIKIFGLMSAGGVVMIYFVVIVLLPNIFSRYDYSPWLRRKAGLSWMDRLVSTMFHFGVRYPRSVVALFTVSLLAAMPQISNVVVETNLQEFFTPDHEVRKATAYVESRLVGTTSLEVVFSSYEPEGLKSPERLSMIRAFQDWAESLPEVDKTVSLADFMEEMHWGFNEEKPEFRRLPEGRELISQYILVYDGEDMFDFVDQDLRVSRVSLNANIHGANQINELMDEIRAYLSEHMDGKLQWDIAGAGRLFADQEELLVKGQVYSLGGAVLIIFLLMLLQWRSIGSALLCMIPNLSPIVLIFIIMGIFGIWLDMATAMIASVAVGIAVDDTIHVYHGFISRVKRGVKPVFAIARTYRQAGRAVMTTTIILCAQFLVLVTSQFVPTANFGLLTTIGLVSALLFDLLLLPALLILIYGRSEGSTTNPGVSKKLSLSGNCSPRKGNLLR